MLCNLLCRGFARLLPPLFLAVDMFSLFFFVVFLFFFPIFLFFATPSVFPPCYFYSRLLRVCLSMISVRAYEL